MSIEPSAFLATFERSSKLERFSGWLTMYPTTSVTVSDQKASFGGSCPAGKCRTYSCLPLSVCPEPSFVVVQYAASSNTLTTGRALAQAARTRIPLPGWPHFGIELQPLTVVVIALITVFMVTIAVRNASVAPMMIPCTTPECATHARTFAMSRTLTLEENGSEHFGHRRTGTEAAGLSRAYHRRARSRADRRGRAGPGGGRLYTCRRAWRQ